MRKLTFCVIHKLKKLNHIRFKTKKEMNAEVSCEAELQFRQIK